MKKYVLLLLIFFQTHSEEFIQNGVTYCLRRMKLCDKSRGHISLLHQLTDSPKVNYLKYALFYMHLNKNHIVVVVENCGNQTIVASGTLFIERKLIHGGSSVGHIEDIVTDNRLRGLGFGKKIVTYLAEYARQMGCYKVILDCEQKNIPFYEKCGFVNKGSEMEIRF